MNVPFLDLARSHGPLHAELVAAFERVLREGAFILGSDVPALERELAAVLGVRATVGVSSGTDALLAALMALDVGPGDEVIVPTLTFFATAGAVVRLGATPRFVDVDPETLLMDVPQTLALIGPRTRAIIPVHLFGQCVALPAVPVPVIEDVAQAFGATFEDGVQAGARGLMGCFSFFPSKPLGGFGDGGLISTDDLALAETLRQVRAHGAKPKFHHPRIGGNFRLDTLQAALLRVKVPHVPAWNAERRRVAALYRERLAPVVASGEVRWPRAVPGTHVHHQLVVLAQRRDALMSTLGAQGIGVAIYYPEPLHVQPCFAAVPGLTPLPIAEAACREVLALPCYPGLTEAEVDAVTSAILRFYGA